MEICRSVDFSLRPMLNTQDVVLQTSERENNAESAELGNQSRVIEFNFVQFN